MRELHPTHRPAARHVAGFGVVLACCDPAGTITEAKKKPHVTLADQLP
jgi:hypothetical protein